MPRRLALAAAVAAMVLEATVSFGVAAATPGHSLLHDYISTAGATDAPYPTLFMVVGLTAASLHVLFVASLWNWGRGALHRAAVGLFAAFFVLLAVGLAFPCDPGCALETVPARIHFFFGLTAFTCLGLAAAVQTLRAWREPTLPGRTGFLVAGATLMVLDILLLASDRIGTYQGITERSTILAMMAWTVTWIVATRVPARPGTLATRRP